ncbi:hypothetical protein [Clostridium sp.]
MNLKLVYINSMKVCLIEVDYVGRVNELRYIIKKQVRKNNAA